MRGHCLDCGKALEQLNIIDSDGEKRLSGFCSRCYAYSNSPLHTLDSDEMMVIDGLEALNRTQAKELERLQTALERIEAICQSRIQAWRLTSDNNVLAIIKAECTAALSSAEGEVEV